MEDWEAGQVLYRIKTNQSDLMFHLEELFGDQVEELSENPDFNSYQYQIKDEEFVLSEEMLTDKEISLFNSSLTFFRAYKIKN